MKKTILFLEQQSWRGGAQRVLEAIVDSVAEEFDPIVAFPDNGPFRTALADRGIEAVTLPIGNYRPGRKSYPEMAGFALRSVVCGLKLAAMIQRRRVALVYINGPRCLPAGVLASWLTGRPSVFHLHLILTRKLEVLLAARLARYVSKVVFCSQAAGRSLLDADPRLGGKAQVLYSPVADILAPSGEGRMTTQTRRFTLGMVGRITETKGQHLLLNAVGRLPLQIKDKIHILIVGAPAPASQADLRYAEDLQALALRHGLKDRVVWAGYQADPGACYAAMDVLVHPALFEGMGLVILEAFQRGVPVIAARTGGIPEIVDHGANGLLAAAGDEDALGQALALFVTDESLRERLKTGASSDLDRRFSLKTFSEGIRNVVHPLCRRADPREPGLSDEEPAAWN